MPAKSKVQQKAAGAALSAKRGKTPKSKLRGASRGMYESMSERQLEDFASTRRTGKPTRKSRPARKTTKAGQAASRSRSATARKSKTTRKPAAKGRTKASR